MIKRLTTIISFVFLLARNYIAHGQTVSQHVVVPTSTTAAVYFNLAVQSHAATLLTAWQLHKQVWEVQLTQFQ